MIEGGPHSIRQPIFLERWSLTVLRVICTIAS